MLNWLLNKVRPTESKQKRCISRDDHNISRKHISRNALKVLSRLNTSGFDGYLVGGGVRDLLLNKRPKDFDVATNATPEQVRRLFKNSRIIGRRFKIVHVRFGPEIIEVTTFRGHHEDGDSQRAKQAESGMLLRDNVYGDIEQDAARRDFTINALYYSSKDFTVHDFCGGMDDINNRVVRMIGDPETRYREDPVRLLRALRFAAKLNFKIDKATEKPIRKCAPLLEAISPARLFDEVNKLFMSGDGLSTLALMREYGIFKILFAETDELINSSEEYALFLEHTMRNTDTRIKANRPVTPAFLYAALLWPMFNERVKVLALSNPIFEAIRIAANEVFDHQIRRTAVPKRFSQQIREIWEQQWRLPNRAGARAAKLREHPRFRASYDFLLLREAAGEQTGNLGKWWTDYQEANPEQRESMSADVKAPGNNRRRRRPRRRKPRES